MKLFLAVALAILAATPAFAQAKTIIKYAIEVDTRHPYWKAAEMMAQRAAELSKNQLEVQLFPSAQLGGSREMVEGPARQAAFFLVRSS
jgi:TRAP-type C4-dicarboxylate transport system substrate-binding protein